MAARSADEKLPRSHILRSRTRLRQIRTDGRRFSNRWMTLFVQKPDPDKESGTEQVAFMTPKKIGPAVLRNKVRRRMREIYRRCLAGQMAGEQQIWAARAGAAELSFAELKAAMLKLVSS